MSNALQSRVHRLLIGLINSGSSSRVARMTIGLQGIGVLGLNQPQPKSKFELVFTERNDFLELHERQAGVGMLIAPPSLYLDDESQRSMSVVCSLEEIAGLTAGLRWSTRISNGYADGDDDVWLNDWLCELMNDSPAVDSWVREALIAAINVELLADIQHDIEQKVEELHIDLNLEV